ncbi:flagellar brake protein [Cellulomonas fimi]|uniref:Type IV pilus assembly PilZ n=1 Tax=Cellulomonas fimi (strain ATCC 484 / DSM 20113 / JCM 1341 / CCUG 24087 / LMG 16345 / NBRC 15513 / NCIMB 8980 / NCTC 7547 / NRS-133) TaxID=590998 RepID=F4H7H8_CELFA|nr:PilZ domain-containing protein [Cellulomonas fimi]AEE44535.1 type IV pilus assembly PilZ [Cellulomonas fimi ATCC 484]NNH06489.1 PilZ domain-containing protein [Cellulomonas fimi]VEH26560.1 Predicted glycosyltransferase [Cellulomonas fimi]
MHDLARCALSAGDRVIEGFVVECDDGTMTVGTELGASGTLQPGTDVKILVLDDVRGEVRYSGWVTEVGLTRLHVTDLELTSMLQKRKVARVRIAQICTGTVVSGDAEPEPVTFVVVDVGAHGMRISTAATLREHDRIDFRFPAGDRVVPLVAEVLRRQRTSSGATQYGCRFVELGERESDDLFRFVLRTQLEQRRSRLHS